MSAPFLLVATPKLRDPNFQRAVVLVLSHDAEGSYGLVLNRPLARTLADVVTGGDERVTKVPLHEGGPVQGEVLQILGEEGGVEVVPGVGALPAAGDLAGLLLQLPVASQARAYLGYAGWGADQLASELEEGAWILAEPHREHVFDVPPERLWSRVLWELGGSYRWLSLQGGDPDDN